MASSTASIGEGAIAAPAVSAPAYKNPFLWVPSSYLTMGLIYVTATTVANIMFKNMGMDNEQATKWSSNLGWAYVFKPLWAPLLELYKTKKFFVVLMQFVIAAIAPSPIEAVEEAMGGILFTAPKRGGRKKRARPERPSG